MPESEIAIATQHLRAIRDQLTATTARIRALDRNTLHTQIRLAVIPAPTHAEQARAAAVAHEFALLGYETRSDAAGNVVATFPGPYTDLAATPVVCMAHLDTVFDADTALTLSHDGDRLICPGIGDNSRGLSVMLTLAQVMREWQSNTSTQQRPIEFVASVGEEGLGNLRGARAYFENRRDRELPTPLAVVVLDGPGDQNIVHHALGSRRYRVTFGGAGGHSWADFGAPNAIHAASRATAWLADIPRNMNGRVAVTVSGIGGGESMNAIPSQAWIEIDVRATEHQLLMRVDAELRQIVRLAEAAELSPVQQHGTSNSKFAAATAAFYSNITVLGERPAAVLPREHPLVQLAQSASRLQNIESVSAIASTDANIPLSLGIPAVTIGGGGTGGGAHTVHEWYENADAPRGVARAFAMLAALAR